MLIGLLFENLMSFASDDEESVSLLTHDGNNMRILRTVLGSAALIYTIGFVKVGWPHIELQQCSTYNCYGHAGTVPVWTKPAVANSYCIIVNNWNVLFTIYQRGRFVKSSTAHTAPTIANRADGRCVG
jgi:hypothetical protein